MTAAELKPCPYRRGQRGNLICTVAALEGGDTSNIVGADVCQKCDVPEHLLEANCKHLQCGTRVFFKRTISGVLSSFRGANYDCPVYAFKTEEELFTQCASACPSRKPIHRDISQDELLTVDNLPKQPTDRDIRQGVLVALYEYHVRFPERFLEFDVTPAHLALSLGLTDRDLYRVLAPMDEAGEVRTIQDTRDILPRYVTITHKGIEAITHEPLFENKGIRVTDNSIKIEGSNNQVAREHGHNEQVNIQAPAPAIADMLQQLTLLRGQIETAPEFVEVRTEALDTIDMVFEEVQRPEPRQNRLMTNLRALHRLLERNPATVDAAGTILQLTAAVGAMALGG